MSSKPQSQPDECFVFDGKANVIGIITRGEHGYRPTALTAEGVSKKQLAELLNCIFGVSRAQAAAMRAGARDGWDHPAAKPDYYRKDGSKKIRRALA